MADARDNKQGETSAAERDLQDLKARVTSLEQTIAQIMDRFDPPIGVEDSERRR